MTTLDTIVALAKRRGFIYPGSEIYGGLSNSWDFGPAGAELKKNIKDLWWKTFVHRRDDIVGLDAAIIMNPKVWEASGHVKGFTDPLIECKKCHVRFRADTFPSLEFNDELFLEKWLDCYRAIYGYGDERDQSKGIKATQTSRKNRKIICPSCNELSEFTSSQMFNLMFKTGIGPKEDSSSLVYLRPETAQGQFVDFKNVLSSNPKKLPFGIAQMGKAFRNEITTGNFLFRLRELEQMEIEYFIRPPTNDSEWQRHFEHWRKEIWKWFDLVGVDSTLVHEHEIPDGERAHYSKRTIDFEFEYPFGTKELYGLAYRTDYDLTNHQKFSGQDLTFTDQETGETFIPHVIEPTWGVDRTFLAVLLSAYHEDGERIVLRLKPSIAPYLVAIFPLLRNKPDLMKKARDLYLYLKSQSVVCAWDDRGNIGKRYYSQDEIGTPWCVTIDFDTLKDDTVTVRDRDTAKQERVAISKLVPYIDHYLHVQ